MKKYISYFNILLLIFFVINFLQAIFTPIAKDEAYYWVYSQALAWGYFDHPPMVALFIKLGTLLFDGVLGVRLMTVILITFSLLIVWQLVPENNRKQKNSVFLFFILIFATPVLNIYGFITTPDVPLIFFGTLYLFVFQKFINKQNLLNTFLLGLIAALLIYSKYHGGILIIISILSQIKVLKRYNIYLSGIVALLLIIPHILWQYNNDFVTFDYHLNQRTDGSFNFQNIGNYLLGSFGILNPALLIFTIILTFKHKINSQFNKTLIYTLWGFLLFFFFYSFRGKIEAQWIAISIIPLIILLHNAILNSENLFKITKIITFLSIAIILIIRLLIILPIPLNTEFNLKKKPFYESIHKSAEGKPVVFVNSYQDAAKYYFYTRELALSLNNIMYRKNQYDVGDYENLFNNKKIFLVGNCNSEWMNILSLDSKDTIFYKIVERLPIFDKIKIKNKNKVLELKNNTENNIEISITNPYNYDIDFNSTDMPFKIQLLLISKKEKFFLDILNNDEIKILKANSTQNIKLKIMPQNISSNKYKSIFTITAGYLYAQAVSSGFDIEIKN